MNRGVTNTNPSAWFVYAAPESGTDAALKLSALLGYQVVDYREGGDYEPNPNFMGIVFDCGANPEMSTHKFIPSKTQSYLWVLEHDFFGEAICPHAADPYNLDERIKSALKACGFKLKVN